MEEMSPELAHLFSELMTLLDRIEVEEDHTLAKQRFDIVEKHDMEIVITGIGSDSMN